MTKANWKGSSGWNSYDDPTGILEGTPLFVSAGDSQVVEDYITQEIGTSNPFNKDHYQIKIDLAFYSEYEITGKIGLITRSTDFTSSVKRPYTVKNCYIVYIDIDNQLISLIRRRNEEETLLMSTQLMEPMEYYSKYSLTLSCYGSDDTTIQLLMGQTPVLSYTDNSALTLYTGNPGIYCSGGKFFINNFAIMELNSDGTAA
jgi:hypothetical protein